MLLRFVLKPGRPSCYGTGKERFPWSTFAIRGSPSLLDIFTLRTYVVVAVCGAKAMCMWLYKGVVVSVEG